MLEDLDGELSADRTFSFRQDFSDSWYDLHNPEQTSEPMTVSFDVFRSDFPPNVDDVRIQDILVYFVTDDSVRPTDGDPHELPDRSPIALHFTEAGSSTSVGGEAPPSNGILSTRREQGIGWLTSIQGKKPFGEWELSLPKDPETRKLFNNDQIDDILFIVTYEGDVPDWPS